MKSTPTSLIERNLLRRHRERREVDDTSALLELVKYYRDFGREDDIRDRVREFMAEVGTNLHARAWCHLLLGQSSERRREYEEAIAHYRRGVACEPGDSVTAYFLHNNLGFCLSVVGRHADAEWYCVTAIKIDGRRANGYKNLGISPAGQGDLAHALECWIQATRVCPADGRALALAEELVEKRPDLLADHPEVAAALDECRRLVSRRAG